MFPSELQWRCAWSAPAEVSVLGTWFLRTINETSGTLQVVRWHILWIAVFQTCDLLPSFLSNLIPYHFPHFSASFLHAHASLSLTVLSTFFVMAAWNTPSSPGPMLFFFFFCFEVFPFFPSWSTWCFCREVPLDLPLWPVYYRERKSPSLYNACNEFFEEHLCSLRRIFASCVHTVLYWWWKWYPLNKHEVFKCICSTEVSKNTSYKYHRTQCYVHASCTDCMGLPF